jgi:hypothetical protein
MIFHKVNKQSSVVLTAHPEEKAVIGDGVVEVWEGQTFGEFSYEGLRLFPDGPIRVNFESPSTPRRSAC